ncbi:MAG: PKD domain-containing protein, partial [Bacteroidota bacterium]
FNTSTGNTGLIQGYEWDFGNGQTSTLVNPNASFNTPGIYQVKLRVTDIDGCIDSVTHPVNVRELPSPDFTVDDSIGCAPATFLFVDQSLAAGNIVSRLWDFGDGNTANQPFPNHTYTLNGTYTVSLTITDEFGCVNTVTRPDFIKLTPPDADFAMDQNAVCPGTDIQFTDVSNGIAPVIGWNWDFGDGTTSNTQNPVHAYQAAGTYTVSLTIFDDRGCSATVVQTDTIQVFDNPNAGFTPSAISGCPPLSVSFTNTTGSGSSPILNWQWTFDNGNNSIFTDPVEVFTNPGTYNVQLVSTDDNGCTDTVAQTLTVFAPPVANFAATDTIGCSPINVGFLDQTLPGSGNLASWSWTFGDGNGSPTQFPTHTYTSDGLYDVDLVVVDVNGCTDAISKQEYIRLTRPTADFLASANQICPGTNMSFLDKSIPDTTIVGWLWEFGDGVTSTDQNPVHIYTTPGQYTISLTVTNVLGCSHTLTQPDLIEVLEGPNALFTPSDLAGCTPFTAEFIDNSLWTTSPIVSWAWDFGDGNTSTAQNPNYTFTNTGTYSVMLIVTDNQGCTSSLTRDLTALVLPTANFISLDTLGCAPHPAQFNDLSTGPAPIVGWVWDFGDGNSSNAQFPDHTYTFDGDFDVTLEVEDNNGCRDTLLKPDYIQLSNPQAGFAADVTGGCPGLTVQFTDTSIPDTTLVSWLWDFGDGTTSIVQDPTHTYDNPGSYTVSLTITNVKACSQTSIQPGLIQVSIPPVADFLLADSISCAPFAIDISDNTQTVSAPIQSWSWDFGTGDMSNAQEPNYTYPVPGNYIITLQVVDANGCGDQASKAVIATDRPIANFVSPDTLGCAPQEVTFFDQTVGPYPVTGWEWSFGDFFTGNGQNVTHTYSADGIYDVRLIVSDDNGCRDTVIKEDYIRLSHPESNFTLDETVGCPGLDVTFTDLSVPDTTLIGWVWDFGDGGISVQQNPTHSFDQAGAYDVKLTVTNILGCEDSVILPNAVRISTPPEASFNASDTSGCVPFSVNFVNFSTASAGIVDQQWIIDGIAKGQSANFSQFFDQVGEYEVILIVTDANGCSDTATQMVFVRPVPVADFTTSDIEGCSPEVITFFDLTVHAPTQWVWEFGDGATSNEQNPVHTYQEDGIYTVKLTVTDEYGCTDEAEKI